MVEFSSPVFLLLHSCAWASSLGGNVGEMFVFTYYIMGKWNKPAIVENKKLLGLHMGIHFWDYVYPFIFQLK